MLLAIIEMFYICSTKQLKANMNICNFFFYAIQKNVRYSQNDTEKDSTGEDVSKSDAFLHPIKPWWWFSSVAFMFFSRITFNVERWRSTFQTNPKDDQQQWGPLDKEPIITYQESLGVIKDLCRLLQVENINE